MGLIWLADDLQPCRIFKRGTRSGADAAPGGRPYAPTGSASAHTTGRAAKRDRTAARSLDSITWIRGSIPLWR